MGRKAATGSGGMVYGRQSMVMGWALGRSSGFFRHSRQASVVILAAYTCTAQLACLDAPPQGYAAAPWQRELTVAPVTGDLTGYSLLVVIESDDHLADHARDDASDMTFWLGNERRPHDIERWDPVAGDLVAWVSVDLGDTETIIHLSYGGDPAEPISPTMVWRDFAAVWHATDLEDASGNLPPAQAQQTTRTDGLMAGALQLDDGYLTIPDPVPGDLDFTSDGSFTASLWVHLDGITGSYQVMLSKGGTMSGDPGYAIETGAGTPDVYGCIAGDQDYLCGNSAEFVFGEWTALAMTVDRDNDELSFYKDGEPIDAAPIPSTLNPNNAEDLTIGSTHGAFIASGLYDEIRIARRALSPEWIAADFASQSEPSEFVTVGPPQ